MSKDEGSDKILKVKDELTSFLKDFIEKYKKCQTDTECITKLVSELVIKHSAALNTVSKVISDTHNEFDFNKNKNLQQDYLATVENFVPVSLKIIKAINKIAENNNLNKLSISSQSYVTIQRFINTFSNKDTREKLSKEFVNNNISISGFTQKMEKVNQKINDRMKTKYLKVQLWIGIPLLLICATLIFCAESFMGHNFNGIQLIFLKALISLSVSIVGSTLIEGKINTEWTLQTGLIIRAAGWLAVFLLLYYVNPASPGDVH